VDDGFDDVADELYALPPADFTASRDERAAAARAAGDRALGDRLRKLRKPSTSAWLANILVRERAEEVEALLTLGAALREAQASLSGAALMTLSRQRHQVVSELSREALRLAADRGNPVPAAAGVELENTLKAALSDETAAEEVRAGRLTTAQQPGAGGFGAGTPGLHVVAPLPDAREAESAGRRKESEATRRRAQKALADAEATLRQEVAELDELRQRLAGLEAELTRVRADASLAERNVERLEKQTDAARLALDRLST
jgi:hypothetical protein